MDTTMQLLARALDHKPQQQWATDFGLSDAAFSMAKRRGKLSPSIAGAIAIELGEPVEHWVAVAGLEQEKTALRIRRKVIDAMTHMQKL